MSTQGIFNFNAGPAALPAEVIQELGHELAPPKGGRQRPSILEISHRSKEFTAIIEEAHTLVRELLEIPAGYHTLFLQGGASHQFAMLPLNLMDQSADYLLTGYWSQKAVAEGKIVGQVKIPFSSAEENFRRIPRPEEVTASPGSSYLHLTANNTIYGTQYAEFPKSQEAPLIADMSSDILSRQVQLSDFGAIYACAQKNLGPSGLTLVIIRDDLVQRNYRKLPKILRYQTQAEKESLYNTPPVFQIYAMCLILRRLKKTGGIPAMEKINRDKAGILYRTIDESEIFANGVNPDSRSLVSVTFNLPDAGLEKRFLQELDEHGFVGVKGHRAVGGFRASLYNGVPLSHVEELVKLMKDFERTQ